MTIKEEIKGLSFENLPTNAMMAPTMMDFFLIMKKMGFSESASRMVLTLSANLKEKQMKLRGKDKYKQLDIFDREWLDVDNDQSISVQFSFNYSDFLPKGSTNTQQVKAALDELQEKSYLINLERKDKNGVIRKYQLKSAMISSYVTGDKRGFKITMNNYWYIALIDVSYSFNPYSKHVIHSLPQSSMAFYMYLKTLPFIPQSDMYLYEGMDYKPQQRLKGTRMKIETFKETFDIPCEYPSQIKRDYLDRWRSQLNANADLSFAYRMDDKYIYIVCYQPNKMLLDKKLIATEEKKIRSAVGYKIGNKKLSESDGAFILEYYLKYSYPVVFKATERKSVLRNLNGSAYVEAFGQLIENYVRIKKLDTKELGYENYAEMRRNIRKYIK